MIIVAAHEIVVTSNSTASTKLTEPFVTHMYRWDFPTINRAIAFRDTPLKGRCIVSTVDTYFQWATKRYILTRVAIL